MFLLQVSWESAGSNGSFVWLYNSWGIWGYFCASFPHIPRWWCLHVREIEEWFHELRNEVKRLLSVQCRNPSLSSLKELQAVLSCTIKTLFSSCTEALEAGLRGKNYTNPVRNGVMQIFKTTDFEAKIYWTIKSKDFLSLITSLNQNDFTLLWWLKV